MDLSFTVSIHCRETNSVVATICAYITQSEVLSDEIYVRKTGISISRFIAFQPKILTQTAVGDAYISLSLATFIICVLTMATENTWDKTRKN